MIRDKKQGYMIETALYLMAVLCWYLKQWCSFGGDYLDSDNYFHAIRLMEAINNGYWQEHIFPYTDYPFGEVLHWTRALDVVWFLLASPLLFFFGVKEAVFYGGLLICPLFFTGAVFYLLKAARFFMNYKWRLLAAVLILVQSNVMRVTLLNYPDHHVAFVFFSAFIFYKILKFIKKGKTKDLTAAALMCSLALWMAAEGIFLFIATAGFLFYGICFLGYKYQSLVRFCLVYALGISFFFIINPPYQGYLFMDNGRLSLFYVAAMWFMVGVLFIGKGMDSQLKQNVVLFGGCLILFLIYYFCGFLLSPLDERIIIPFVSRIREMSTGNIYTMAYPVAALICGYSLFKQNKTDGQFIFLMINLVLFSGLTAGSMHFLPYSGVYGAFVLAYFVSLAKWKKLWIVFFVALEFVSFILYALFSEMKPTPPLVVPADVLASLPKGTIATELFYAPYVIWYGGHPVIASPYHRNVEGILDNHRLFFSSDESEVLSLIKKHQVKYIFLPVGLDESYYQQPLNNCDKLYGKILGCHNYPKWLKVLHQGNDYYLLEVNNI